MKPYARQTGKAPPKLSTAQNRIDLGRTPAAGEFRDKTQHSESRPGKKENIRNAKRAQNKSVRQKLKKEDGDDMWKIMTGEIDEMWEFWGIPEKNKKED